MSNYAIIENGLVSNVVVSDNEEVIRFLFPAAEQIILETTSTGAAYVNGQFLNGVFIPPKPFDSWIFSEESLQWVPPIARPQDEKIYSWNESGLNWVEAQPIIGEENA